MGDAHERSVQAGEPSFEARVTNLIISLGVGALLAYWALTLIAPFLATIVWAVILAVTIYPSYAALRGMLGGRGGLAATIITLIGLAIILGPLAAIAINFAEAAQGLAAKLQDGTLVVPAPPETVKGWPLIGARLYDAWNLAATNLDAALEQFGPALLEAGKSTLSSVAGIASGLLGLAVSILIAGFLFGPGPGLASGLKSFAHRLDPAHGAHFIDLAGATIRNIARGVVGMALLQAFIAFVVLALFGVPAPGVIAFAILVLCAIGIGPVLVLIPLLVWAWMNMDSGSALFMTLLLAPLLVIDNVLRPIVMAKGLSTPMLIIIIGVIGGTVAYGLLGLFLGPVVLGVVYELVVAWLRAGQPAAEAEPAPPA